MLMRIRDLAGADLERRRNWVRAYRWARDRCCDHVVHIQGQALPLFPSGSLEAAGNLDDDELRGFMSWLCFARAQYLAFI